MHKLHNSSTEDQADWKKDHQCEHSEGGREAGVEVPGQYLVLQCYLEGNYNEDISILDRTMAQNNVSFSFDVSRFVKVPSSDQWYPLIWW